MTEGGSDGGGCTETERELGMRGGRFALGVLRRTEFCGKGVAKGTLLALIGSLGALRPTECCGGGIGIY